MPRSGPVGYKAADAKVRLSSGTVSRPHAELFRDPFGRWWVRDLGSRHGVRLAGRPVTESVVRHRRRYDR